MGSLTPIPLRFPLGIKDGFDKQDVPRGAVWQSRGFEFRRRYPRTERAREKKTSSEIRTSKRVRRVYEWVREDASKVFFAICDGGVWKETTTGGFDFTTLLSQVEPGGTAARSGNTVTGTSTKFLYTVNVGDYFYYDSDGASAGGLVASVDTDTQITLSAYAGSATSGAYTVWRKLNDGRTTVAVAGDRLWFADGTGCATYGCLGGWRGVECGKLLLAGCIRGRKREYRPCNYHAHRDRFG
jgi:hypothetical protein